MATAGKIPLLGFRAQVKNLVWLGFGASGAAFVEPTSWDVLVSVAADAQTCAIPPDVDTILVPADAVVQVPS